MIVHYINIYPDFIPACCEYFCHLFCASGSIIVNSDPFPSSDSTEIEPLKSVTIRFT